MSIKGIVCSSWDFLTKSVVPAKANLTFNPLLVTLDFEIAGEISRASFACDAGIIRDLGDVGGHHCANI